MTILIITNSYDLHADLMQEILTEWQQSCFRLNLNEFPKHFHINYQIIDNQPCTTLTHLPSGEILELDKVGAVWARKSADFCFESDDLSPQELAFAQQETKHVLNSLVYGLDCYWMSHPSAVRYAAFKGEQAIRAAKMGFDVPDALVTNCGETVKAFKQKLTGQMITKAMSDASLSVSDVALEDQQVGGMPTTLVSEAHMENIDAVREIPTYFQAYNEKQFELRVTVIGEQAFAAKIDSQSCDSTRVDYRDFSAEIAYEAYTLPTEVEKRCLDFVHSYQLEYGAIDLIVTPDNKYVFLENNPVGQFWFVQQLVPELQMLEAVADKLVTEAKCRR